MIRRAAVLAALACGLVASPARADVSLPALDGHVVDPAHQLDAGAASRLNGELDAYRRQSGHAIVVLVLASLEGETIDDVAYRAFNTWGVGDRKRDDGVLIVVATGDRKVRIEVGKGLGGALTDLQANDIIRNDMAPLLKAGKLADGVTAGAHAVEAALAKDASLPDAPEQVGSHPPKVSPTFIAIAIAVVLLLLVGSIFSPTLRSILWGILQVLSAFGGSGGGSSGGGGSSDSY